MYQNYQKEEKRKNINNNYEPLVVHIDLTILCNLNCIHCRVNYKNKSVKRELKKEEIKKVLTVIKNYWNKTEWISLGGGEPLLRKDIFYIIKIAKEKGFKVLLTTNGLLINEKIISKLQKSKLTRIQVSIEGMKKIHEKIRGKGTFDKLSNVIDMLRETDLELTARMTLNKINYKEVPQVIKFLHKKGVQALSLRRVIPHGNAISNWNMISFSPKLRKEYKKILIKAFYLGKKYNLHISSGDPVTFLINPSINKKIKKYGKENLIGGCTPGITYLYISSIGDIKPCPMLDITLGNIKRDNLFYVWNNSRFYQIIRERALSGKCGTCKYKFICGGCRASALFFNKSLWGYDPFCLL